MISFQDPSRQDTFYMPTQASTFASDVDGLMDFVHIVALFFFVLTMGIVVWALFAHRRKHPDQPALSNVTHNTPLEVTWTVIPLIIVMIIFAWGWKGSLDMGVVPGDAVQYRVEAYQWGWNITHPDGTVHQNKLVVPEGQDVKILQYSRDVLHSFFIPAFRVKRDVLPGRYQALWFRATTDTVARDASGNPVTNEDGLVQHEPFDLFCTEYCGRAHSMMVGQVYVVPQEEWDRMMGEGRITIPGEKDLEGAELGKALYTSAGCVACHSLDGSVVVGPSFKGIWGREGRLADGGTYVVDADYVKESILNPMAKVAVQPDGSPYLGVMSNAFSAWDEKKLNGMIEWFQSDELK